MGFIDSYNPNSVISIVNSSIISDSIAIESYDADVFAVINEEAIRYFEGECSIDETIELIQSRLETIMNERRNE